MARAWPPVQQLPTMLVLMAGHRGPLTAGHHPERMTSASSPGLSLRDMHIHGETGHKGSQQPYSKQPTGGKAQSSPLGSGHVHTEGRHSS